MLQEAGVLLDQKEIRKQVDRVFSIWKQRKVYDEAFIKKIQDAESKLDATLSHSLGGIGFFVEILVEK